MIKDVNNNEFQEIKRSILKYPHENLLFSIIGCSLCTGVVWIRFLVWKLKKIFLQESDILRDREISLNHDQNRIQR